MPRFRVHSRATLDVLEIVVYLSSRSPQAALRFIDAVDATYARIRALPQAGARLFRPDRQEQDWRFARVSGFKSYVVYYRVDYEVVSIVRVAHGSRDTESLLRSN